MAEADQEVLVEVLEEVEDLAAVPTVQFNGTTIPMVKMQDKINNLSQIKTPKGMAVGVIIYNDLSMHLRTRCSWCVHSATRIDSE